LIAGISGDDPTRTRTVNRSPASGLTCSSRTGAEDGSAAATASFNNRSDTGRVSDAAAPDRSAKPEACCRKSKPSSRSSTQVSGAARANLRLQHRCRPHAAIKRRPLDGWSDRRTPAVFTPEVQNRKRFRASDDPSVGAAALRANLALRCRNFRSTAALGAPLCLDGI
jgi:hypothetical protein